MRQNYFARNFLPMFRFIQYALLFLLLINVKCQTDTNYRLNPKVTPSEYEVTITPYFDTGDSLAFTFDGEVSIKVKPTEESVNQIKLHSEDLEFVADNVTVSTVSGTVLALNDTNPLEFDTQYTFVYINLATPLSLDTEYIVNIVYRGPIRSDLNGFYRSSYVENGETKWLAATQMEPVHTRKAFPCFDEPEYKATFTFIIDRPSTYSPSLTNMKRRSIENLSNGFVRETFFPTPVMSSYLTAILVSEFQNGDFFREGDREFGVWVRPEATNQSEFAYDFGTRVVDALGSYFDIDYYSVNSNMKLDHVGIPDFRAGAMENWGLVKYRENLFMYVPTESTPYYKYRVAQIIAHETTHMWFGNLVTCHWWSDTWLNEGFANYFQDYITAEIEPELGSADLLVTGSVYTAYNADESPKSAPITNIEVNSPTEISGHFGGISYQKAGSIIRMIHHWIGDEAFKRGLNRHLDAARLNVVEPLNLYVGLQKGVDFMDSLQDYPGYTVEGIMGPWITQAGHPVIQADYNLTSNEVTLTQRRFYTNDSIVSDEIYPTPISYTTSRSPNFNKTKPSFILAEKTSILSENFTDDMWIIFNIQEVGFYRVNYCQHLWSLISKALKGAERTSIHNLNRAKIVNDLFAFTTADLVTFEKAFDVLEFLTEETDYSVWFAAISGLNSLRNKIISSSDVNQLESYSIRLLQTVIEDLGYQERQEDNFVTLRNRMQVLEFACKLGHQGCIDHAIETFQAFIVNGVPVSPSQRPVTYCYGLKYGTADDYDFLYQRMVSTNVANEAQVIQQALACTTVQEKLQSYLSQMVDPASPLRNQDFTAPLTYVLSNPDNIQLALTYVKENYAAIRQNYTTISTLLSLFPAAMTREEDLAEFATWLEECSTCQPEDVEPVKEVVQAALSSSSWTQTHLNDIVTTLKARNNGLAVIPSLISLVCVLASIKILG